MTQLASLTDEFIVICLSTLFLKWISPAETKKFPNVLVYSTLVPDGHQDPPTKGDITSLLGMRQNK